MPAISAAPAGAGGRVGERLEVGKVELQAENEFDIPLVNASVKYVCVQLVALVTAQPVKLSA